MGNLLAIRPVHPFPARMAPSIVWSKLAKHSKNSVVLDPMVGSGTTLVAAKMLGHKAIGFDTDPLAVIMARVWSSDIDVNEVRLRAQQVTDRALTLLERLPVAVAYPHHADDETCAFVRYWFDPTSRRQLTALSRSIYRLKSPNVRLALWCAFSRLIITKKIGVSLGIDISHSRPHRVYEYAPIRPLEHFTLAVEKVLASSPFTRTQTTPLAQVNLGDARKLPLDSHSIDFVATSPPYLNAIDYLRGHKLSLVWMGYKLQDIRKIRSNNIGAEVSRGVDPHDGNVIRALSSMGDLDALSPRTSGILGKYVYDMNQVFREIGRVIKRNGTVVIVIGDSKLRGVFIRNSAAVKTLAKANGLSLISSRKRPLPDSRRYLPPPSSSEAGEQLQNRIREEVILTFRAK